MNKQQIRALLNDDVTKTEDEKVLQATAKFSNPHEITIHVVLPQIEKLKDEITEIKKHLFDKVSKDAIIDQEEFIKRFGISKKTAQVWRNQGLKFSQPTTKKIYYKLSWIEEFIESHTHEGF